MFGVRRYSPPNSGSIQPHIPTLFQLIIDVMNHGVIPIVPIVDHYKYDNLTIFLYTHIQISIQSITTTMNCRFW